MTRNRFGANFPLAAAKGTAAKPSRPRRTACRTDRASHPKLSKHALNRCQIKAVCHAHPSPSRCSRQVRPKSCTFASAIDLDSPRSVSRTSCLVRSRRRSPKRGTALGAPACRDPARGLGRTGEPGEWQRLSRPASRISAWPRRDAGRSASGRPARGARQRAAHSPHLPISPVSGRLGKRSLSQYLVDNPVGGASCPTWAGSD